MCVKWQGRVASAYAKTGTTWEFSAQVEKP